MSGLYRAIATASVEATADTPVARFVGYAGDMCAAGAKAFGVSETEAAAGEMMPVAYEGIMPVEASAAIAVGDAVESAADGKAAVKDTGVINGYAVSAAAAAGDLVQVKLV